MRHLLGFPTLLIGTIQQVSSFVPFASKAIGQRRGVFGLHERRTTCFTREAHRQHQSFAPAHCGDHANDEETKTTVFGNDDSLAIDSSMTRRKLASVATGIGLTALLAGPSIADEGTKRTVVITGANSGIGLDAAKKLGVGVSGTAGRIFTRMIRNPLSVQHDVADSKTRIPWLMSNSVIAFTSSDMVRISGA